jgi:hypothetical protein
MVLTYTVCGTSLWVFSVISPDSFNVHIAEFSLNVVLTINVPVVYGVGRNDFDVGKTITRKGWALKFKTFLGSEMATSEVGKSKSKRDI